MWYPAMSNSGLFANAAKNCSSFTAQRITTVGL
ncbi:hypothetical protein T03_11014 [Trichinella britovi]|uniref:Uncharacterized protein n=1 Tax=Trichinella britovi TaxID=45882 RepID=A0A0V0YTJ2_TRIBR|nr:hypothetical protein T03_11014 [Trichinella britovi]